MRIHNRKEKESNRKKLRQNGTKQEIILWSKLKRKQLGVKFRRQHSIGEYIVDFYCPEKRLIVEINGWQHRTNKEYDSKRSYFFESLGFRILRFWNGEIDKDIKKCRL